MPVVSVIVPTYNRGNMLRQALYSIFAQGYSNMEIIVVDDGSSEDIQSILASIKHGKIIYIRHKSNRGIPWARNSGISVASGDFVAFLDSDDLWLPMKLAIQLKILIQENKIGLTYSGTIDMDDKGYILKVRTAYEKDFSALLKKNFIGTMSTVMVKRDVFEKCGLFDTNLDVKEDYDFYLRVAEKFKIVPHPTPLVIHRVHKQQSTHDLEKRIRAHHYFLEKHQKKIRTNKKAYAYQLSDLADLYFRIGDFKNGLCYVFKSCMHFPRISILRKTMKYSCVKMLRK